MDIEKARHENLMNSVKEKTVLWIFIAGICFPFLFYGRGMYLIVLIWMIMQFFYVWNVNGTFLYLLEYLTTFTVLVLLSYFAVTGIVPLIVLNILVPFLLVIISADQYDKFSYFNNTCAFGYMEVFFWEFGTLGWCMAAIAYISACLAMMYLIFSLLKIRRHIAGRSLPRTLRVAASALLTADMETDSKAAVSLDREIRRLNLEVYRRNIHEEKDRESGKDAVESTITKISCDFMVIFELLKELISSKKGIYGTEAKETNCRDAFEMTGKLLNEASEGFYAYGKEISADIAGYMENSGNYRSFPLSAQDAEKLKTVLEMLQTDMKIIAEQESRKVPRVRRFFRNMLDSLSFDDFRFRFAVRMSIAFTAAFVIGWLTPSIKSYWIAFNTIFLMMPIYEDVKQKIKKRSAATLIGVAAAFLYFNFVNLPFLNKYIVIVSWCLMCVLPDYMLRTAFGAVTATLPATATAGGNLVFVFRLVFLLVGILIVMCVNRFILRTSSSRELGRQLGILLSLNTQLIKRLEESKSDRFAVKMILVRSNLAFTSILEYSEKEKDRTFAGDIDSFVRINRAWQFFMSGKKMPDGCGEAMQKAAAAMDIRISSRKDANDNMDKLKKIESIMSACMK